MFHAEYSSNRALPMLEAQSNIDSLLILLRASGFGNAQNTHLSYMVDLINNFVSPSELISLDSIRASPFHQKILSKKLEDHQFSILLEASSPLTRFDSFHAASRHLLVLICTLTLRDLNDVQWWLGMDMARVSSCPGTALDLLGNHATICKRGRDVVTCHNHLCSVLFYFCHCANLGVRMKSSIGLTPDLSHIQPVDVLVLNWKRGKNADLDITVTS